LNFKKDLNFVFNNFFKEETKPNDIKFNFKKYISTSLSENIPDYKKLWRPYKKSSYFDSFEYGKSCDRCGKSFKTPCVTS
jgi:hypothetical protein